MVHVLHDVILVVVILLHGLGVYSGFVALMTLRSESDFSMQVVWLISLWCVLSIFLNRARPSFSLVHLWGLVWVIVNCSTIASAVFCLKQIEYMMYGGSRILGAEWAFPWILAHVGAGLVVLLIHAAVHGFAPLFELEMKPDD